MFISVTSLPSPPLAGPANGNSRARFRIVLDESCLPVLLRVLSPQVAENTARNGNLHRLYTQPNPLAGYARTMRKSVQGPGRHVIGNWPAVGYGHTAF